MAFLPDMTPPGAAPMPKGAPVAAPTRSAPAPTSTKPTPFAKKGSGKGKGAGKKELGRKTSGKQLFGKR